MSTRVLLGVFLATAVVAVPAARQSLIDIQVWGYQGVSRARMWVGPEGRISHQSLLDGHASAWDIWPTLGTRPTEHARSELTLHRQLWSDPCQERINLIAMANEREDYRVSLERSAACTGDEKGLKVCFDNPIPGGPANCRFWVRPDGVYVSDDGQTWRRI